MKNAKWEVEAAAVPEEDEGHYIIAHTLTQPSDGRVVACVRNYFRPSAADCVT